MEEARNMMAEIFPSLESDLLQFVSAYERLDSFFTMNALVSQYEMILLTQSFWKLIELILLTHF